MEKKYQYTNALLLLILGVKLANAVDSCDSEGDITISNFTSGSSIVGCVGSYYQINIPPKNLTNIIQPFELCITEEINSITNPIANIAINSPYTLVKDAKLASKTNEVKFSITGTSSPDTQFSLHYKEIKRTNVSKEYEFGDNQIILDPLRPNNQIKQTFWTKLLN